MEMGRGGQELLLKDQLAVQQMSWHLTSVLLSKVSGKIAIMMNVGLVFTVCRVPFFMSVHLLATFLLTVTKCQ